MNKLMLLTLLFTSLAMAQDEEDKVYRFQYFTVVKTDVVDKYIGVIVPQKNGKKLTSKEYSMLLDSTRPICYTKDRLFFNYEMLGIEDSYYTKSSRAENISSISKNTSEFKFLIELEEDVTSKEFTNISTKICSSNNASRYTNNSTAIEKHGIIKYIGDISINPPF